MNSPHAVRILLFAGVRDAAGRDHVDLSLSVESTAADVVNNLADEIPEAADLVRVSRLAVDGQYVSDDFVLHFPVSEVALIPPVSGG